MAPELQAELCECAAGKFVPLILRETHDARWDDLTNALDDGARYGWHGILLGSSRSWVVSQYGMDESVFERLRGASRDRPPAIEEIAMGLLLTADAMAQHLADMGTVDPGDHLHDFYVHAADVPLTLAPLYALSAGADSDDVHEAMLACFASLCDARGYLNTPREPKAL